MPNRQLSLIPPDDAATRIGRATFAAIMTQRRGNADFKLTEATLIECLRGPLVTELPHAKRVGKRNPLFDALATACGYNGNATRAELRTVGCALRDIVEADPAVQPEGITATAKAVLRKFDNAGPMAVASHWTEFSHLRRPQNTQAVAPAGWLAEFNRKYSDSVFAKGGAFEITSESDYEFYRLDRSIQSELRKALS